MNIGSITFWGSNLLPSGMGLSLTIKSCNVALSSRVGMVFGTFVVANSVRKAPDDIKSDSVYATFTRPAKLVGTALVWGVVLACIRSAAGTVEITAKVLQSVAVHTATFAVDGMVGRLAIRHEDENLVIGEWAWAVALPYFAARGFDAWLRAAAASNVVPFQSLISTVTKALQSR